MIGSVGGWVVKLLVCRGPGFDSRSRYLNFRDWLSSASKSRYGWNTAKATYILNTTNWPTTGDECNIWYVGPEDKMLPETESNSPQFGRIDLGRIRFSMNWLLHHHTCPRHPGCRNNQLTQLGTHWFWTRWLKTNRIDCDVRAHQSGPTLMFICPRSNIDFYMLAASNI